MLKEHAAAASNLASKRKAVACCDVLLCRTEHATTASKLVESKEAAVCAVKSTHDDCLDRKHAERKEGGRRRVAEHAAPTDVSARRRPREGRQQQSEVAPLPIWPENASRVPPRAEDGSQGCEEVRPFRKAGGAFSTEGLVENEAGLPRPRRKWQYERAPKPRVGGWERKYRRRPWPPP
jgi:hypothetical protein